MEVFSATSFVKYSLLRVSEQRGENAAVNVRLNPDVNAFLYSVCAVVHETLFKLEKLTGCVKQLQTSCPPENSPSHQRTIPPN